MKCMTRFVRVHACPPAVSPVIWPVRVRVCFCAAPSPRAHNHFIGWLAANVRVLGRPVGPKCHLWYNRYEYLSNVRKMFKYLNFLLAQGHTSIASHIKACNNATNLIGWEKKVSMFHLSCLRRFACAGIVCAILTSIMLPTVTVSAASARTSSKSVLTDVFADSTRGTISSDRESAMSTTLPDATLRVPKVADKGITIGDRGNKITIRLPGAQSASEARAVSRGVVSYPGLNGFDNMVQATDAGVRMMTSISSATAPVRYEYKIDVPTGGKVELCDGGAIVRGSNGTIMASVAKPWAMDAGGNPVPTQFTTDGRTLVQSVFHTAQPSVSYPVIADPSVSWGWKMYVTFNKSETRYIASRQNQNGFYYGLPGAAGCFFIGAGVIGFGCGGYVTWRSAVMLDVLSRASNMNGCFQVGLPYGVASPWTFWSAIYTASFSAIRC